MNRIYVEIDALLDTRYPIVHSFTNEKDYINRINDDFKFIGYKGFTLLYKNRNINLLLASKLTKIIEEVIELYTYKLKDNIIDGINEDIHLDINVSPYKLSTKQMGYLSNIFSKMLSDKVVVKLVRVERTENLFKEYYALIMYEGLIFLNKSVSNKYLRENSKPNTIFITNMNMLSNIENTSEVATSLMKELEPYINLQLVPHEVFSQKF